MFSPNSNFLKHYLEFLYRTLRFKITVKLSFMEPLNALNCERVEVYISVQSQFKKKEKYTK